MISFLEKSTLNLHLPYYRHTLLSVCGVHTVHICLSRSLPGLHSGRPVLKLLAQGRTGGTGNLREDRPQAGARQPRRRPQLRQAPNEVHGGSLSGRDSIQS